MSKFTRAAATSHTLSVTAMEEASRLGERTAGLDHLFLALVVNEQVAGQVLRSFGITLEDARDAVAAQHADQLASLGIHTDAPEPKPISFHETGDAEWGASAHDIIVRSSSGDRTGDAVAVLRELLDERSGLIEAVLARLGTTPAAVRDRLDEAARYPAHDRSRPRDPDALSGTAECFVPADIDAVWNLLADPARMPEWDPSTGTVDNAPATPVIGDCWIAHARVEHPDGTRIRVSPAYRVKRLEVTDLRQTERIEWLTTWSDAPTANSRRIRIDLEPAAGGTQLTLTSAWVRNPDAVIGRFPAVRSLLRLLLRPLHRFAVWLQLTQLGAAISRVFRSTDA